MQWLASERLMPADVRWVLFVDDDTWVNVHVLRRIVAPLLSPSLLAGWLFVFLLGGNELSMAVLLAGSRTRTIAVALFDELQGGQAGDASALGVVWTLVMTGIATTMYFVGRKQSGLARH